MPLPERLRLITIDLDETVWPCDPVLAAAEEAVYVWLQRQAPRLAAAHDHASLRRHRLALAEERPAIAHDFTRLRHASMRALLEEFGYPPQLAEGAVAVFLTARNRVTPFPDVAPALSALARRYVLAALTNGNADVRQTPLSDHFHHAFTAGGVGAAKPHPAIFHAALGQAAVGPENAIHVGDDPWLDCHAARQVGLSSVWVNRNANPWPDGLPPPDLEVRDFAELAARLLGPR